jgi:hypothetical protein
MIALYFVLKSSFQNIFIMVRKYIFNSKELLQERERKKKIMLTELTPLVAQNFPFQIQLNLTYNSMNGVQQ